MHNIFLHDVEIFSGSELIYHLNNVLKHVSIHFNNSNIVSNLIEKGEQTYLNHVEHEVFIEGDLGDVLNLNKTDIKKVTISSLRDILKGWIEKRKFYPRHPVFFLDKALGVKWDMSYYVSLRI